MMTFLKKRSTAIIIVVIVGVVFTLLGARLSLDRQAAKVEAVFYDGAGGETAVNTYLDNLFKEAKTVYTVAANYMDDDSTAGFRAAYNDLYNATGISKKYDCYARLMSELNGIAAGLDRSEITLEELQYADSHINNMRNISRMIDSSDYNVRVAEFEKATLGAFPANVLKLIVRPHTPEYFNALREG
jgi:hypothetical protein